MKNICKYLLVLQMVVVFVVFNIFICFAYRFEGYKTFGEYEKEINENEVEWYDDHNFPYRIQFENDDGDYEYEYCNCDDYEDWVEKSDELLEGKEEQKETSSNKKGGKNSLANTNASDNKLDPNVFYGMKKEQCPTEEALYKMEYYKQPFDVEIGNDLNSGSPNHYDDNKTAYFYPIQGKENYVSFIAMTQDGVSEYGNTIFIIDFCQFLNDGQGNWILLSNIAPVSYEEGFFQDDEEKKKYEEQIEKAKSDVDMLVRLMDVQFVQNGYNRDVNGYMLYKQANIQNIATLYLKKSDYVKAQEVAKKLAAEKQAKLKNSQFRGTYASQLFDRESSCAELSTKISNASSWAEKQINADLLKVIATSALSFAKSIYVLTEVDKQDKYNAISTFSNYLYIAYSAGAR